jgi:hypothetical protein
MGVGELPDGRPPVGIAVVAALAAPDVTLEAFKEFRPAAGPDDEHVAAVVLISFAAQIAERTQGIQGAGNDGLGDSKDTGEAADGMGAGRQIDNHEKGHLTVGQIRLSGSDVAD